VIGRVSARRRAGPVSQNDLDAGKCIRSQCGAFFQAYFDSISHLQLDGVNAKLIALSSQNNGGICALMSLNSDFPMPTGT
jgi:hypothetical protein